jgi:NAD(P)-dependent dehydrogenase (short-subunit alcohol dehydrogenase family)
MTVSEDSIISHPITAFPSGGTALVIGAAGGIGAALTSALSTRADFDRVVGLSRSSQIPIDITDEASIAAAAAQFSGVEIRLIIIATGLLSGQGITPEKSLRDINGDALARSFMINTIGPALVLKHFLPLLPRTGKSVCAAISARVGSISDNRLGGWYGYRAAKSALNQVMRTASVEIARSRPDAVCVALHPGTVATPLSAPFAKLGLDLQSPDEAAARLLSVIDRLAADNNGQFFDHMGVPIVY